MAGSTRSSSGDRPWIPRRKPLRSSAPALQVLRGLSPPGVCGQGQSSAQGDLQTPPPGGEPACLMGRAPPARNKNPGPALVWEEAGPSCPPAARLPALLEPGESWVVARGGAGSQAPRVPSLAQEALLTLCPPLLRPHPRHLTAYQCTGCCKDSFTSQHWGRAVGTHQHSSHT